MKGGRPGSVFAAVALSALLALAGCKPAADPADLGKAVVSVPFAKGTIVWPGRASLWARAGW